MERATVRGHGCGMKYQKNNWDNGIINQNLFGFFLFVSFWMNDRGYESRK